MFLKKKRKPVTAKTIAVKSAISGAGVTHFCLCMAHSLAVSGYRVAVVEWNGHQELVEIEKLFSGFGFESSKEGRFRLRRVDYYKNYQGKGFADFKKENYDYIIADMGKRNHSYFEEADYPIFWLTGSEWKAGIFLSALEEQDEKIGPRLHIGINFGNEEEKKFFQKHTGGKLFCFPFWKDPFSSTPEQRQQIEKILE